MNEDLLATALARRLLCEAGVGEELYAFGTPVLDGGLAAWLHRPVPGRSGATPMQLYRAADQQGDFSAAVGALAAQLLHGSTHPGAAGHNA